MTGGNYSLVGGFWSLFAIQTPGAPYLWVMRTETKHGVRVVGRVADELAVAGDDEPRDRWERVVRVLLRHERANCVYVESPPVGNKFYRLQKP